MSGWATNANGQCPRESCVTWRAYPVFDGKTPQPCAGPVSLKCGTTPSNTGQGNCAWTPGQPHACGGIALSNGLTVPPTFLP